MFLSIKIKVEKRIDKKLKRHGFSKQRSAKMINEKKLKELDSHWKEVMDLAQKYGFIGQAYGGTAVLLTHKNQLEMYGKETYIYRQRSMFEIDMEALKICYLTDIPDRMKNSRMVLQNSMAGDL